MSAERERVARAMHRSLGVTWGTSAPYRWDGPITLRRVGFAHEPRLLVPVIVNERDVNALVPLARQRAFAYLAERAISDAHLEFHPYVGRETLRGTVFVDDNEASESYGRRKRGHRFTIEFVLSPLLARAVRWESGGYRGVLPERWE